jgi:hypothetical protein
MIGVSSIRSWDEIDYPGIKEITEEFERHHRKPEEKCLGYLLVFALGATAAEVIEGAADRVGLENLNGRVIKEEIEKIKDFHPLDVTNLTILPGKRSPSYARIEEVKEGRILPLTDWRPCPDMRPSEYR